MAAAPWRRPTPRRRLPPPSPPPALAEVLRLGEVLHAVACPAGAAAARFSAPDFVALACSSKALFQLVGPALLSPPFVVGDGGAGGAGGGGSAVALLEREIAELVEQVQARVDDGRPALQLRRQVERLQTQKRAAIAAVKRPLADRQKTLTWALRAAALLVRLSWAVHGDCRAPMAGRLKDGDAQVRKVAAEVLGGLGALAAPQAASNAARQTSPRSLFSRE